MSNTLRSSSTRIPRATWVPLPALVAAAWVCLGCAGTRKHADYVRNPRLELREQPAGVISRKPKPPQRPVGAGLWSGWKTVHNIEGGAFGVTPVVTRALGPRHHAMDVSGLVGFFSEIYMRSWYPGQDKYLHFSLAGELGGGSAGLDGRVSHAAMGGFRFPFATSQSNPYSGGSLYRSMSVQDKDALDRAVFTHSPHAVFVRGGYLLRYSAVGSVLGSAVELPRLELGYQLDSGDNVVRALELRANAGLVLVGRFNVEGEKQPLGGDVAWGGALVLHSRSVHTELGAERIQGAVFGARAPAHRVDTRACLRIDGYLVCLEELLEHGSPGGSEVTAWRAGLFLGFDGLD